MVFGARSVSLDSGPRLQSGEKESDGESVWSFACSSPGFCLSSQDGH